MLKKLATLILFLTTLVFAGCLEYDLTPGGRQSGDSIYVRFFITTGEHTSTRAATPTAGENGDGHLFGRDDENNVYDLTIFMFRHADGINAPASIPFISSSYIIIDKDEGEDLLGENSPHYSSDPIKHQDVRAYTVPFYCGKTIDVTNLQFAVVANAGNLTQIRTLGDLRDYIVQQPYFASDELINYSHFVMSSERNSQSLGGNGYSWDDPIYYHVDLERLAARIDFDVYGSTLIAADDDAYPFSIPTLKYPVRDGSTTTAQLYVDNVKIVNGNTQMPYLFKRVTKSTTFSPTDITYLGDELEADAGGGANYVIEPNSTLKTEENRSNSTKLNEWYGASSLAASLNAATFFATAPTGEVHTRYSGSEPVTSAFRSGELAKLPGTTNHLYYAIGYVNENTFERTCAFKEYATGLLLQCHYAPEAAYYVTDYDAASDAVTTGTYTLGTPFYRFVPSVAEIGESKCLYFQKQTDAEAYAVQHQGTVTAYPTGQCYYYIWLRHAYNSELGGIMEFGTVRDNIYRICIEGISGAGTPAPDPLEPEQLRARIYVKRWVEVEHPAIFM